MAAILSRPQCVETECKHDGNFVVICDIEGRHNYSHDAIFILISATCGGASDGKVGIWQLMS